MTWEDVLKRNDIIGGDIETQEDGVVYRGPLSGIKMEGNHVHFESPWCARMENGKWKTWPVYPCFVEKTKSPPQDIGNGRIQFNMPFLGFGVIFPKGGSKLDHSKVEGLQLTVEKKGVDLDDLQEEAEKLLALLKDRQPGLMT